MLKKSLCIIYVFIFCVALISPTIALDTTEPFDIGFTDSEMYFGLNGAGLGKGHKSLAWEHLVGAGITDRFSTMFFYSLESNEFLADKIADVGIGLFLTIIDMEMFDFDICGSVCMHGAFVFATEFNLDFKRTGIQLTIEEGLENGGDNINEILFHTALAPLFYFSITESMQLLTAIDVTFIHNGDDGGTTELGGAALGYNIGLNNAIELITEIGFDIPQSDEDFSMGISVGFVATLPLFKK